MVKRARKMEKNKIFFYASIKKIPPQVETSKNKPVFQRSQISSLTVLSKGWLNPAITGCAYIQEGNRRLNSMDSHSGRSDLSASASQASNDPKTN